MRQNEARDQRSGGRGIVASRQRQRWRMQPTLLVLEDRRLLSTIVVNNPTDTPATGQTDLRQAIAAANTAGGANTIDFDSTVFGTPQTITLTGGQLELSTANETVTITGPAGGVTVSGGGNSRVFLVDANVTASISGMTITGGSAGYDYGGGLFNHGTTSLSNCTVSGNSAGFSGGGVATGSYSDPGGTTTLLNCTVSGNSGGGLFTYYGTTTAKNTIIAGNDFDVSGSLTAASTNNLIGGDPLLAPLGNYGGTSQTMALLPGSPAIGAGTSTGAPTTDQRGFARVGAVDIGAFQSSGFTIAYTSGSGQSASGTFAAPLVATVTANNSIEPVAGGMVTFTAPASGASARIPGSPAVISADGEASVTAASNFVGGSYTVAATAAGIEGAALFNLTNYAAVSIAVSPGDESLAVGVAAQYTAVGTFTDGSTQNITNGVAWASAPPSVAAISGTGVASGVAVGTSQITASLPGVTSPGHTLKVIAPSFVVNTTGDAFGFYSGTTSLREAIASANVVPGQTITFDKNVFKASQTITLDSTLGQLELSDASGTETIVGPKKGVTVSGGGNSRVFQVDANVTASISGMTITGGNANANADFGYGGGLLNYGATTLTNCTVSGNSAFSGGGLATGSFYDPGTNLTLINCTVSGNHAELLGGGLVNLDSVATLTNCTIMGNSAAIFGGGGLWSLLGTNTLTGCTISGNSGPVGGGLFIDFGSTANLTVCTITGNYSNGRAFIDGVSGGGGLASGGTTTLTGCTITGNSTARNGGGVSNMYGMTSLLGCTVSGNSATGTSGFFTTGNGGGIYNGSFGSTTVTGTNVKNNSAVAGGGIANAGTLNVSSSNIINNQAMGVAGAAGIGGGILGNGGSVALAGTTLKGNQAIGGDGASGVAGGDGIGGGLALENNATATVSSSAFLGNVATGGAGGVGANGGDGIGGAIAVGTDGSASSISLSKGLLSLNAAQGGKGGSGANGGNGEGGGLFVGSAGSAALDQFDVYLNMALAGLAGAGGTNGEGIGGGLYVTTGGVVTLHKLTVFLNLASTSNNNIYGIVTYD
jgi:hypothetical protein